MTDRNYSNTWGWDEVGGFGEERAWVNESETLVNLRGPLRGNWFIDLDE